MRADQVVVFGKAFDASPRFVAIPGMPVPPRYRGAASLKYFREKYGDDSIRIMHISEFSTEALSGENIETLKAMRAACEAQAQTIQKLEAELASLKKRAAIPAVPVKS